jgi:hypothetical protein
VRDRCRAGAGARQTVSRPRRHALPASGWRGAGRAPAITLHTIETISPVAQTWGLPVTAFTISPGDDDEKEAELNARTREAARDALGNPAYAGKTVIMTWEHKHIAKRKLEKDYPYEPVTLRQLLRLDQIKD